MNAYIIAGLAYLFLPIIITWGLCFVHKRVFIVKKMQNLPRSRQAQANLPKPLWPLLKERVRFALKDSRPFSLNSKKPKEEGAPVKTVIRSLWIVGLASALAGVALSQPLFFALAPIFYLLTLIFSIVTASPILKARQQLYQKMFEVGKSTLGLPAEYAENPQAAIEVLEWRDILSPTKVRYIVPTNFNADSEENFQRQFNQVFGTETTWVPFNDPEAGTPGWNYKDGFVTLKETPPLPAMAPWSAHYVLDPSVAWSFFPIALGVEGGIELTNPNTGEVENVLGFDLSGEQVSLSKKMGTYCSPTITTSPMCFPYETLVVLSSGKTKPIGEIADDGDPVEVLSLDDDGEVCVQIMHGTRLTRSNASLLRLVFTSGEIIDCTPDHLFMVEGGEYVEARDLSVNTVLASVSGARQELKEIIYDHRVADVFDGEVTKTHNFMVSLDPTGERRVVVHNCLVAGGTGGGKALSVSTEIVRVSPSIRPIGNA